MGSHSSRPSSSWSKSHSIEACIPLQTQLRWKNYPTQGVHHCKRFCAETRHKLYGHVHTCRTDGINQSYTTSQCVLRLGNPSDGCQNSFPTWQSRRGSVHGTARRHEGTRERIMGMLYAQDTIRIDASHTCLESSTTLRHDRHRIRMYHHRPLIYMRKGTEGSSIVAIHVDDMCAAASNMAEMAKLKEQLGKFFSLVNLGELKWLLGISVTRDCHTRTISLCQGAYIESITK